MKSFSGDMKYIRFMDKGYIYSNQPSKGCSEWLFDQSSDPKELENLVDNNDKALTHMKFLSKKLMKKEMTIREKMKLWEKNPVEVNKKLMEQLKALGYIK